MKNEMALSALNKHWVLKTSDDRQVQALCQHFELPEIVARVLVGRHIAFDHVADFLKPTLRKNLPDPFHLRDMDKAISRIVQAIENHESIMLLGDYDVDGATSTSLMYTYLKDIGACVSFYIPDRMIDGYGPSVKAMETFAREKVNLVITLDCGTTAFESLSYAKSLGLDVIVIDHHVAENKLPDAVAVVNPNRLDETSPLKHVAAVGLAFMVSVALNSHLKKCGFFDNKLAPDLLCLLDLVALGTVCDVMPLQGLNRAFVAQGLKVMANRKNKGLKALADKAGLTEKPTPYHLGYLLGPRINAGGRVGDATLGTRLLITSDTLDAEKIATELNHYNSQRQALEAQALDEAKDQAHQQKDSVIVVVGPWHPGIVGIIAGRLKDMYHRPVFCLSLDKGIAKGSGRSITGFDLGFFVHKARELGYITAGGGHAMAAGVTLREECIKPFQNYLVACLTDMNLDLTPTLFFEGYLSLTALTPDLCKILQRLEPYGQGHPMPRFCFEGVRVVRMDILKECHFRLIVTDPFSSSHAVTAMVFRAVGSGIETLLMNRSGLLDMIGTLQLDTWGGDEKVKMIIDDIRIHASS